MKKKLSLSELKVKSFVTQLSTNRKNLLRGGTLTVAGDTTLSLITGVDTGCTTEFPK